MSSALGLAPALAAFELGDVLGSPAPVGRAWSNDVFRVDTPRGRRWARCHRWVRGEPAERPLPLSLIEDAGRYLGRLHALHRPGGDTSRLPGLDTGRWTSAVRNAGAHRLVWADQLAALTPLVAELAADLETLRAQCRPMRISHRDYDPKNAVVGIDGRLVVTDWDHAGPVLPDVELLVAATSFGATDDEVAAFVSAYRAAGGDAPTSDALAMTAEAADLDWLLRNVEACVEACVDGVDPIEVREHEDTAADLIAELPTGLASMRAWPRRFAALTS